MNVLVTGGVGFIGSNLTRRLLRDGHRVHILDNLSTGKASNKPAGARLTVGDVRDWDVVRKFRKPDWIFHLACPASPPAYQVHPLQTFETAILGAKHVLTVARETGARVVMASSSETYGHATVHPQPETYWGYVNSMGCRSCYDESKRAADTLAWIFSDHFRVDVRSVKIHNTYGPFMDKDDGRVVSNFITQALREHPFTIYGDGKQTRSLCYIDDLVEGLMKLVVAEKNAEFLPINLGNPREVTVYEIAELISRLTCVPLRLAPRPLPQDDPPRRCPDISRAKRLLGWEPKVTLEDGLSKTIEWYRRELENG